MTNIELSTGALAFDPNTTMYALGTSFIPSAIEVTVTVADGVSVAINGADAGAPVLLSYGDRKIEVVATLGDRRATYTIEYALPRYLKNADPSTYFYGVQVAIDGDTMVAGGDEAADVYVRDNGQWTLQQSLTAGDLNGDVEFGNRVAISGDTVVVGAPVAGAAYVYVRNSGVWAQQAKLVGNNTQGGPFGDAFGIVAISGDTIAVGAQYEDSSSAATQDNSVSDAGAVYVFVRDGVVWTQQSFLKAPTVTATEWFGHTLALEGDTLAVGGPLNSGTAIRAGVVYILTRSGTTWTHRAVLQASRPSAEARFSDSLDMRGDTLVAGGNANAVFVFQGAADAWTQPAEIHAPGELTDVHFGGSVSLAGPCLAVGASSDSGDAASTLVAHNINAQGAGAAFVLCSDASRTTWTPTAYVKAANATAQDAFGYGVALSEDVLVCGAVSEDGDASSTLSDPNKNNPSAGAVYVFER